MGLFEKIFNKAVVPNRIIFDDFAKNYHVNMNRVDEDCKSFIKDVKKMLRFPFIQNQIDDICDKKEADKQNFFDLTQDKLFAKNMATTVTYARMYAIYYLNTDAGKTKREVKHAFGQIEKLYDIVVHLLLTHYIFVRREMLQFENGQFLLYCEDKNSRYTLDFVNLKILKNIVDLAEAMEEGDNTKVFAAYSNLCSLDINIALENPFEDF